MKNQHLSRTPKKPKSELLGARADYEDAEIVERLRVAVKMGGGNKAVAEKSGIPLRTLANYLAGRSEIRLPLAAALCRTCGVSLQWLAYGNDQEISKPNKNDVSLPIDTDLLTEIIRLLDEWLSKNKRHLAPEFKGKFITEAYIFCREEAAASGAPAAEIAERAVVRFLRLVA